MRPAWPQTRLTLVVLAFVYMRPALTVRLNYGFIMAVNSMEFNGVRPAPNIQFGLASDLRLGRHENANWDRSKIDLNECEHFLKANWDRSLYIYLYTFFLKTYHETWFANNLLGCGTIHTTRSIQLGSRISVRFEKVFTLVWIELRSNSVRILASTFKYSFGSVWSAALDRPLWIGR